MPCLQLTTGLCSCRYGDNALFVQMSDDHHYDGKPFQGKQAARPREVPPEYLLPLATAARQYVLDSVRAKYDVKASLVTRNMSQ